LYKYIERTDTEATILVRATSDEATVAAGDSYSVALDKNGNVYTWGYNGYGNLGLGNTDYRTLPVKVDNLQGIIKIAAGNVSTFAIDNNNHLWAAGYNGYGNLGYNGNGQFGVNNYTTYYLPQQMKTEDGRGILQNIKKVSAGATHTIVLSDDGTAYATGYNGYGQLGIGDTTTKILPTKMIDTEGNVVTRIKDIEANGYSSMVSVKPTTTTDTTGNQTTRRNNRSKRNRKRNKIVCKSRWNSMDNRI
jgi:alpha-tubulin suppressor-like RCC1 family protein